MTRPQPIFLSIIIPAYNEEKRLPDSLRTVAEYCRQFDFGWEVIAVVERSTDRTVEKASAVAAQFPQISVIVNQIQKGKGYAIRTGVGLSHGEIVLMMDADLSVPMDYVPRVVDAFRADPELDVLVGNRQHPASVIEVRQSAFRERLGKIFNFLVRLIAATELRDTQCGFKALRRQAAIEIFSRQRIDGFAFDVETLMLAERMGFKVRDMPVRWINSPESKVRIVQDSARMLWDLLRVRFTVARTLARRPYRPGS